MPYFAALSLAIKPIFRFLGFLFNSEEMNQLPAGNWKEEIW